MSNTNEIEETASKLPTHEVFVVRDGKEKGFWTKIGGAWPHKDGKGFNIRIDAVPLDGRLSLRVKSEKKE